MSHLRFFVILSATIVEGQAQVRAAASTDHAYRSPETQGGGPKCIDKITGHLSYVKMQAEVSAYATDT